MPTIARKRIRDPEGTRSHILEVAFDEVYRHGFQGVSVDQIIKRTKVTKGAFFHYFPTKSAVGYAIVDEVLRESVLARWIRPLAAYKNPLQGILKTFKKIFDAWPDESLLCGCPLNNLAQEMSGIDPIFREKTRAVILLWIDETEKYLIKAQQAGYLKHSADPRSVAELIVTLQEGAFGMGKTLNDRKIFQSLYTTLRDYLNSIAAAPD